MSDHVSLAKKIISSPTTDALLVRWICFLAAPAVLWFGFWKTSRAATTEAEAFALTIAILSLAFVLVILGLISPLALKKTPV